MKPSKNSNILKTSINNNGIGGMVVCDSADQAKMMYEIFQKNYASRDESLNNSVIKGGESYNAKRKKESEVNTAALILHDVGTKKDRKKLVKSFKKEEIDLL